MDLNELDYFPDDDAQVSEGNLEQIEESSQIQPNVTYEFEEDSDEFTDEEDILTSYLKSKGINPDSIKFQTESGDIEEVSFDNLSREEQLQLLGNEDIEEQYGLEDDEIKLINQLRENKLSVSEYNNYIAQQAVQQYIQSQQGKENVMQVDLIPDDELYIIDLKTRIPELSDEEALEELELAKANTNTYNKKIQSIRDEYKGREEELLKEEQEKALAEQQAEAEQFEKVIVETIQNNSSFDLGDSALELTVDDKNELASFILDTDVAGVRYLAKALNDPNTLIKMAWYALKGEEAFSQISDYYKQEIAKAAKYNYQKGYDDAKNGKSAAKAVVRKPVKANTQKKAFTIDDIDL